MVIGLIGGRMRRRVMAIKEIQQHAPRTKKYRRHDGTQGLPQQQT
jgi:hypothetical protein